MPKLFGTDGVRGVAGEFLSADLALALGRAAAVSAQPGGSGAPQVLIVRDTRESGEMLEASLAAGVAAGGGHALLGGVLPTPGAALLVRRHGLDLAAVVSASHNPYRDNGIKFFGPDGMKISDEREAEIERMVSEGETTNPTRIGRVRELHGASGDYLRELELRFRDLDLSGRRLLIDCANGATYRVAPEIFRRLGAHVDAVAAAPDGRNINHGCGSTHIEGLAERVAEGGYELGFGFDGDGDRVLAVDRRGAVVDGDELLALAALHLRETGRLSGDGVAVTVMTNYGFHTAMREAGVEVAVTPVGDRHVLAELVRRSWALGGEQSGHIIDTGFVPSGDGLASALLCLEALGDGDLADRHAMSKLPQRLVNVRVADRGALDSATAVHDAVEAEGRGLEGRGRVLVRSSGTEPLVRVMVEAPGEEECGAITDRLVDIVQRELGG
ncbi:MAG: phosphoglucosamine mutase [Actinomycetota bacterium]|nr:phosphoglucosamine mutase [Actinomycetota bacterium]